MRLLTGSAYVVVAASLCFLMSCSNPLGTEEPVVDDAVQEISDVAESVVSEEPVGSTAPLLRDQGDFYLLGDDIILNKDDADHQPVIAALSGQESHLAKTTAMQYVCIPTWPKGVVTYSLTGFSTAEKTVIQNAMKTLTATCKVSFAVTTVNKPYVYKISKLKSTTIGGVSTIGYTSNAYCNLVVVNAQVCLHEFMHGLGIGHEHQRFDRDKYITINSANVMSGYTSQFEKVNLQAAYKVTTITNGKVTTSTKYYAYSKLVTGYDYASIMHYPKDAFAKKAGLVTINAKGKVIGTTTALSVNDKAGLAAIYGKR